MDTPFDLPALFQRVSQVLDQHRLELNAADPVNGNHGDHMVAIFQIAGQAAAVQPEASLAGSMEYAGELLSQLQENGSAQVYARGLAQFAREFREHDIELDDLVNYAGGLLVEKTEDKPADKSGKSGDLLKALVSALAGWQASESGKEGSTRVMDMNFLFDLGVAYMQAKGRSPGRAEALADAAAVTSPLGQVPHRYASGKIAIQALLEAMRDQMHTRL